MEQELQVNDLVDSLIIAIMGLILSIIIIRRYRTYSTYVFLSLAISSTILSMLSYYYYAIIVSLLLVIFSAIYVVYLKRDVGIVSLFKYLLLIAVVVEFIGAVGWILHFIYDGVNPYTSPLPIQDVEAKILYSFSVLTPLLIMLFLLTMPLAYIVKPLKPVEKSRPSEIIGRFEDFLEDTIKYLNTSSKDHKIWGIILLASAIIIPATITYSLYSATINSSNMIVSVDVFYYVNWLNEVLAKSNNGVEIFLNMLSRDRPLTLLLLYFTSSLLHLDFTHTSAYAPIFLSPLLAVATYSLASLIFRRKIYASLTSFMISLGPFTTASLYGGFLANWLGLSLTYFSLTLFFKSLEKGSSKLLSASIILSLLSHLAHPAPWSFLVTSTIILLIVVPLIGRSHEKNLVRFTGTFIVVNVLFDFIKTRILQFAGAGQTAQSIVSTQLQLSNMANFWNINMFTVYHYIGGVYNFPLEYLLAILGAILLSASRSTKLDLLKLWVLIGIPLYLLGPDAAQVRTLQNIPVDFFASAGALAIIKYLSSRDKTLPSLFIILIYLLYLNNILRFAANLPL